MKTIYFFLFALLLLTSCSSNYGRYQQKNDSTPVRKPSAHELRDAVPRDEKPSRGGNKNYQVRGINYQVLSSAEHFEQTGLASWYGEKFHGHLTSNGEIYDMYAMSAAHKNLPLPTYLKVTNLTNNKSVIVRVNDRGPFHQERIIDLSYSAAYKLDMLKTGTAKVRITAIDYHDKPLVTKKKIKAIPQHASDKSSPYYIQVFATKTLSVAKEKSKILDQHFIHDVNYPYRDGIFRIFIGPISKISEQKALLESLKTLGYPNAYVKTDIN